MLKEVGHIFGMRCFVSDTMPSDAFMLVGARRWKPENQRWEKHVIAYQGGRITDRWLPEIEADKALRHPASTDPYGGSKHGSWYCDRCQVEVYQLRCKHCGKSREEER